MKRTFMVMAYPVDGHEDDNQSRLIDTFDSPGLAEILKTELSALGLHSWVDEVIDPDTIDGADHNNLVAGLIGSAMGDMTIIPGGKAWDRNDILVRKPDQETHLIVYGADAPYTPTAYAVMTLDRTRSQYGWRLTQAGMQFLVDHQLVSEPVAAALNTLIDHARRN